MNQTNPSVSGDDSWKTKEVLDHAREDLQSHFSDVKKAAQHTTAEVQAAAATTAAAAREGYQAMRQDVLSHGASYQKGLADRIRQQPLQSICLAALGGLVIGVLARK
jgi:ElaB/YqjD/DUF883 family membrane-anchored ribosome-binding protein